MCRRCRPTPGGSAETTKLEKRMDDGFPPRKCQVLNITTKRNIIHHPYNVHRHTLEVADSAKYLGVHIHKNIRWNHDIDQVV
jgi:hypothetical protein